MVQPEVTIEQGSLRGTLGKDLRGNNFLKFLGVPYAKPALGELRFKSPQPPEKWSGVFDATVEKGVCKQRDPLKEWAICGIEDCLYLNIFTKRLPQDNKNLRPVMFWIHGGGLICGSGSEELYGGEFLLTEDIVLVTINYRLGILGFLNFDDPSLEIPGNAGLKDQVMALKWVQQNISKFGGDPNNVTIFGESAGGASVHLHTLSPLSKGLFHKAIAQSGCALNPWVQGTKGTKALAKVMGLEGAKDEKIYQALKEKSVDELLEIQDKMGDKFLAFARRPFGLVVEANSKDAFLQEEPIDIMLSGKFNQVPFMTGYTSNEALCFEIFKIPGMLELPIVQSSVPWFFNYQKNDPNLKQIHDKIRNFYFGDQDPSELINKQHELTSDCEFLHGIYVTILNQINVSKFPIYAYKMTIESELNFFKQLIKEEASGVSHCDDVGYLFKHFMTPEIKPGSIEDQAVSKFVKLWTNFAKFGNPTPDKKDNLLNVTWTPVTNPNIDCLELGLELVQKPVSEIDRMNFWKTLYAESPAGKKIKCSYLK